MKLLHISRVTLPKSVAEQLIDIPFTNKFEWNTMVDYNHNEKKLYSWDKGYQVVYNVTFEPSEDT